MDSDNVLCSSPHCNKLLSNNPDGSPPYSIIKCGHIYHGSCFEQIKIDKFCPNCQVVFNPRHCCKIKLNIANEDDSDNGDYGREQFFRWMFYDVRTNVTVAEFQEFACSMGTDETGLTVYVARAFHNNDILPAYFVPENKRVLTIYENKVSIFTEDIEILDIHNDKDQAAYEWIACEDGAVPDNAVVTGDTSTGDKLYTVRAEHHNKMVYGKLDATKKEAQVICPFEQSPGNISYKVENKKKYEVLTRKPLTMYANQLNEM